MPYALCFIFSYFVFGHSDTILHPMCHRIYIFMSTSDVFCHLMFYFVLSFTIVFPHPMCHFFYAVISTGIWSFILCVQSLFVVFPVQITFLYPMYRILYIAMPTRYVLFHPMCLFQFDSFLHPMCHRLYIFILSRMCSFIVCFILSGPFVMLSPFRCVIYLMMSFPPECVPLSYVSYVLHCLLDCVPSLDMESAFYCQVHPGYVFFILCELCFILVFSIRNAFYHPICHMLYIVISTCDVSFHAMDPGLYCILCSRIAFPIRCVICFILSCPPYVLFYPTCSMFYFALSIRIAIFILCVIMCYHVNSIRDMLFYSI